ncbi:MAG: anaerobic sulfatase-maturation protein [Bacteroidota bacterium]
MHARQKKLDSFQVLAKPIGPICNLDCKYCFYLEKENLYTYEISNNKQNFRMPLGILEPFIKQKIKGQDVDTVSFVWQGGEPTLLGVDYFKKVVEFQKKYSDGKKIENGFQTNGILLNDEWCGFFSENNFLIGISIGGPKELHDKYRTYKGGQPSFDKVMNGIAYLKKHDVQFNTLTVVNKENSYHPLIVYNFLREAGSGFMQFIPVVERISDSPENEKLMNNTQTKELKLVLPEYDGTAHVTDWSVEPIQYGNFLCEIFDEWVKKDVGKYFVQIFDVSLESWLGLKQSLCVFNETCGKALAIEHNGDVYSCDHYVYPENKLGNIIDMPLESLVCSDSQKKFGNDKKDKLPNYCLNCEFRFACNGECPKHRFTKTLDGENGLNYLCAGYKKFFKHIDPYMKFMANELLHKRPPANVMNWVKNFQP